jgi:hypothetical protein
MDIATATAAHRAARAIRLKMDADDVPDGPEYDAAHGAEMAEMEALAVARCANDDAFFATAAYMLEIGEEEAVVDLVRNYLRQRRRRA